MRVCDLIKKCTAATNLCSLLSFGAGCAVNTSYVTTLAAQVNMRTRLDTYSIVQKLEVTSLLPQRSSYIACFADLCF